MDTLLATVGTITMSMELPIGLWPVTLVSFFLAAWCGYRLFVAKRLRTWQTIALIVSSVVIFLALPVYTVAFWAEPGTDASNEIQTDVLGVLMWGYLALVAATIAFAAGFRWFLAGVAAFLVWMNCGVMLVAAMAVSGGWL